MSRLTLIISALAVGLVIAVAGRFYLTMGPTETPVSEAAKPVIGGPFTLVNQDGKPVTEADFKGKLMLIFFGYTFCPDVCPTNLSTVSDALDILGDDAKQVVPIFVSIDPERDTPKAMKEYIAHFHPSMVGLTGTPEQVAAAAKAYRVYFAKVQEKGADPDDYLMDHSAITYLMGRDGQFLVHFGHGIEPAVMAKRIREFL
ncbi:MAG: SCO family protein [Hyphomicrobiales bacterium]|nr:SCO family protein [Hyphomicrobiales bacterium]